MMLNSKRLNWMSPWTLVAGLAGALLFSSCAQSGGSGGAGAEDAIESEGNIGKPGFQAQPLAWESTSHPERKSWSYYAYKVVDQQFAKLDQATDATRFCPNYHALTRNQKINFWGDLFSGIAYYESGWSPVDRMREAMGTDSITHLPVYSEGLLQLSYQDIRWAPYCPFDWSQDRALSSSSPEKTILNPYKNLYCGIRILADQVASRKAIALNSGVYWSTLQIGGTYSQIAGISKMTKRLTFCN